MANLKGSPHAICTAAVEYKVTSLKIESLTKITSGLNIRWFVSSHPA